MNAVLAAAYFGVSVRTIYNWVARSHLQRDGRGLVMIPDGFVSPLGERVGRGSERRDTTRTRQIVAALRYGPLTVSQLAERLPGRKRAVSAAIQEARNKELIHRIDGAWELTDVGRESLHGDVDKRAAMVCNNFHAMR
jgi:hypothetical protein